MRSPRGFDALACVTAVACIGGLAGCGSSSSAREAGRPAASATTRPALASTRPVPPKCAPVAPSLTIRADGHPGNEWVVPVGPGSATLRLIVTQRSGTRVRTIGFEIAPAGAVWPGRAVRRFAPAGRGWSPGRHVVTLSWDGRDDDGRRVGAGRYHLFAAADTVTTGDDPCRSRRGSEGYGVGYFVVRR